MPQGCYDFPRNPLFSSVSPCLPLWLTCHSSHLDSLEPPPHSLTPPPNPPNPAPPSTLLPKLLFARLSLHLPFPPRHPPLLALALPLPTASFLALRLLSL